MKLKKHEIKAYKCDRCGIRETHKDMYDDSICYRCWKTDQEIPDIDHRWELDT